MAPDAATLRALAARLLSASQKEEAEGEEGAVAGSNGAAVTAANSHGRRRRHRGLERDEDEEAFDAGCDRFVVATSPDSPSPPLPPPLLLQPPPPASSPASAAFVFSPEAVASWRGPRAGSRERALEALQSLLLSCSSSAPSGSAAGPASAVSGSLLPRHRLLTLLEQALSAQRSAARAHNAVPRPPVTLLADYGAAVAAAAAAGRLRCGAANGGGASLGGNGANGASPPASLFFAPPPPAAPAPARPAGGGLGGDGLPSVTVQVLLDHGDEVWHLAFSPCGSRLASGGADGVAILWDVGRDARGRRRVRKAHELRGHAGPVALLAWSPADGGATLATAGPDGTVRLWDGRSGERVAVLSHHGSLVTALSWVPALSCSWSSPSAPARGSAGTWHRRCGRLVTAGHDRCVHLVDAGGAIVAAGRAAAEAAARQQRGGRPAAAGREEQAGPAARRGGLPSSSSGPGEEEEEALPSPPPPPPPPPPLSASPASPSRILRTWRGTRVNDLAVTPDGRTLLTVSSDRRVRFWCLDAGAELFRVASPPASSSGGGGAGGRGRGSRLGGAAGAAFPASPSSSHQQQQQQQPPLAVPVIAETESIISLSLSRAGDALLLNLSNQQLHAWRVPARHELAPLLAASSAAPAAGEEREGAEGAGGAEGPPVTITAAPAPAAAGGGAPSSQPTTGAPSPSSLPSSASPPPQPVMTYRGPPARQGRFVVRSCFGGLDDAFALSGAEDCRVYCWDRRSGELLSALDGHAGTVNAVAWNPADPGMFASASDDKSVHVWGLESDLRDEDEEEEDEEGGGDDDGDESDGDGVSL